MKRKKKEERRSKERWEVKDKDKDNRKGRGNSLGTDNSAGTSEGRPERVQRKDVRKGEELNREERNKRDGMRSGFPSA